jgi:hypothetical protein
VGAVLFALPGVAAAQTGSWTLEREYLHHEGLNSHPYYADAISGDRSSITKSTTATGARPPCTGRYHWSWSAPPTTIRPGDLVRLTLRGTLMENGCTSLTMNGSQSARFVAYEASRGAGGLDLIDQGRHGATGPMFTGKEPAGTSQVFDVEAKAPPPEGDTSSMAAPVRIELRIVQHQSGVFEYRYVYRWSATGRDSPEPLAGVAGIWDTSEGRMTVQQTGESVTATYGDDGGELVGTLKGGVFEGHWIENSSSQRCATSKNGRYYWGTLRVTFVGDKFTGEFGWCDGNRSGRWTGTRIRRPR